MIGFLNGVLPIGRSGGGPAESGSRVRRRTAGPSAKESRDEALAPMTERIPGIGPRRYDRRPEGPKPSVLPLHQTSERMANHALRVPVS